jgi:imidazoleglycerol-phosphate dehydratase
MERKAKVERTTAETAISLGLDVDGSGQVRLATGIGFFDHMLTLFARHGLFDLDLTAKGDLEVDFHHTVEDTGITLGQALTKALGDKAGIRRYGLAYVPMDEALAQCSLDLGGRSYCVFRAEFSRPVIQGLSTEMVEHFFVSLSRTMNANLHLAVLEGKNTHHIIEALFKSLAYAMKQAVKIEGAEIKSTKGVM